MITVPGYTFLHIVYEDDYIKIAHAYSEGASRVVLWKTVKDGPRAIIENAKLLHEYEMLADLQVDGILKPHTLLRQGASAVLVFDIFHGIVLRNHMMAGPVDIGSFLRIASQLCEVLEQLHKRGILHMNVRPDTIIVRPQTLEICLTGFSDSVFMDQSLNAAMLEGSPPYMAPERTARSRRRLDERADLYSLGMTFYEMLAGELPFEAGEPLEWAHAHAAKTPPSLAAKYGVPQALAAIVARLLEKSPEERYRSARGVGADLRTCVEQWEAGGILNPFELGAADQAARGDEARRGEAALDEEESDLPRTKEQAIEAALVPDTVRAAGSMPIRESRTAAFAESLYTGVLDMAVMHKASQALTREPLGSGAFAKLLQIFFEYAGVERGCWIDASTPDYPVRLKLEAVNSGWTFADVHVPLSEEANVCAELVRRAASTRMTVRLGDASAEGSCSNDTHIAHDAVRSVLCFPVLNEAELVGLLYAENNLMPHAFDFDNPGVLQLLAKQIVYAKRLAASSEPTVVSPMLQEPELLTSREIEVLRLMAVGLSNKEIAEELHVAAETIKAHIRNIFDKLQVNKRIQAVAEARRRNIIP